MGYSVSKPSANATFMIPSYLIPSCDFFCYHVHTIVTPSLDFCKSPGFLPEPPNWSSSSHLCYPWSIFSRVAGMSQLKASQIWSAASNSPNSIEKSQRPLPHPL